MNHVIQSCDIKLIAEITHWNRTALIKYQFESHHRLAPTQHRYLYSPRVLLYVSVLIPYARSVTVQCNEFQNIRTFLSFTIKSLVAHCLLGSLHRKIGERFSSCQTNYFHFWREGVLIDGAWHCILGCQLLLRPNCWILLLFCESDNDGAFQPVAKGFLFNCVWDLHGTESSLSKG